MPKRSADPDPDDGDDAKRSKQNHRPTKLTLYSLAEDILRPIFAYVLGIDMTTGGLEVHRSFSAEEALSLLSVHSRFDALLLPLLASNGTVELSVRGYAQQTLLAKMKKMKVMSAVQQVAIADNNTVWDFYGEDLPMALRRMSYIRRLDTGEEACSMSGLAKHLSISSLSFHSSDPFRNLSELKCHIELICRPFKHKSNLRRLWVTHMSPPPDPLSSRSIAKLGRLLDEGALAGLKSLLITGRPEYWYEDSEEQLSAFLGAVSRYLGTHGGLEEFAFLLQARPWSHILLFNTPIVPVVLRNVLHGQASTLKALYFDPWASNSLPLPISPDPVCQEWQTAVDSLDHLEDYVVQVVHLVSGWPPYPRRISHESNRQRLQRLKTALYADVLRSRD